MLYLRAPLLGYLALENDLEATVHLEISGLQSGEWLYVRAVQVDGGTAWSSPFFIE